MKKVLVTGAHGFIGHYVIDELLNQGHEVLAMDHHHEAALHRGWPNGVEVFLADVRDRTAVTEAAAHADGLIHLAAVLGTQETIQNPIPSAETNILGSLNVFEAANQYSLPCAYAAVGNAWMAPHGAGAYVITKTCAEYFTRMYNKNRGGRIVAIRPCNAYGPGQSVSKPFGWSPVRKITPAFVCRALSGQPIEVYGDGTQVSDMIYVEDVARAFVAALDLAASDREIPEIIEVGPEESHTVNEVAEVVIETCVERGYDPVPLKHLPMRPGEVPNSVVAADTTTLAHLGMDAGKFVSLEEGLARTVDYYIATEGTSWQKP